jgi:hypothetical protein
MSFHDSKISYDFLRPMGHSLNSVICHNIASFSRVNLIPYLPTQRSSSPFWAAPHWSLSGPTLSSFPSCCFLYLSLIHLDPIFQGPLQLTWISHSSDLLYICSFYDHLWHFFVYFFTCILTNSYAYISASPVTMKSHIR